VVKNEVEATRGARAEATRGARAEAKDTINSFVSFHSNKK
jgi:hypothetical protein